MSPQDLQDLLTKLMVIQGSNTSRVELGWCFLRLSEIPRNANVL